MKIESVRILNYRNLVDLQVSLDSLCNYLIGENNLGKSSFLTVLETAINGKRVEDGDFYDSEKNVEVYITIRLNGYEKGFFKDNFSPEDSSVIHLRYYQNIYDSYPTVLCEDTGESISPRLLKKLHFMKYESTASPNKELKLNTKRGIGSVFNGIVEMYMQDESNDTEFLNNKNLGALSAYINDMLGQIKGFSRYGITATIASDTADMISSLYYLSDGERKIETTGSGVQYIAMATINIVGQLMNMYKSKARDFSEQLYINGNGEKLLPLIVALDEPEVHLHPFLQRSLINYYKKILKNEDPSFALLLKKCFGIDGLDGQLLIVTHSSDILLDDYRNIVRFYKQDGQTKAVSGSQLAGRIGGNVEKHLIMDFKEIKEAFYSHCVVVVEGETEYGCMPYFAEKLGVSLDDNCISIVMARGESGIKQLRSLFSQFKIPSIAVYDGDVKSKRKDEDPDKFFTSSLCLETELINALFEKQEYECIRSIARELDSHADTAVLDLDYVRKPFKYLGVSIDTYIPKKLQDVSEADKDEFCTMYTTWLYTHKGVMSGRIYGSYIPSNCIPDCFVNVFNRAVEITNAE